MQAEDHAINSTHIAVRGAMDFDGTNVDAARGSFPDNNDHDRSEAPLCATGSSGFGAPSMPRPVRPTARADIDLASSGVHILSRTETPRFFAYDR